MRSEGPSPNFVLFDLSKLDVSSALSFLSDWSHRSGSEAAPEGARCHWIVNSQRGMDVLAGAGSGAEFLRDRLAHGDRLLCTNPTGLDWNSLFPEEREREWAKLDELPVEAHLFLEQTPQEPVWPLRDRPAFRAAPEGLLLRRGSTSVTFPWAASERRSQGGVWWLVPGQALLGSLPPLPWADLIEAADAKPRHAHAPLAVSKTVAPSPGAKIKLSEVATLRHSGHLTPLQQSILFHSQDFPGLGTKEAVDFEEALGGIRKRSLVANMQGQTDMHESGLRVRFRGGKLVRIEHAPTGAVLCSGASTFLEWGGKRHPFTVNSAFSFEGDYSWGLRQSLVLEHEDLAEAGRAIVDYYFVEESKEFFVAATVRWPRWKAPVTVNRWAPIELTLFEAPRAQPLSTRVVWPDGRSADSLHSRGSGVLEGTDFVFSGPKALVLGFPQNQAPRPHALPWSLTRRWGRSILQVNPEGGDGPCGSAELDGVEEHFSFYLALAEGAKLPFSVTRKQAIELIPPYVIAPQP